MYEMDSSYAAPSTVFTLDRDCTESNRPRRKYWFCTAIELSTKHTMQSRAQRHLVQEKKQLRGLFFHADECKHHPLLREQKCPASADLKKESGSNSSVRFDRLRLSGTALMVSAASALLRRLYQEALLSTTPQNTNRLGAGKWRQPMPWRMHHPWGK